MALLCVLNLNAQSTRAELFGSALDPRSLPVAGASVELQDNATGVKRTTITDSDGRYSFAALYGATYQVKVSKDGFTTLTRDGIRLQVGDRVNLELSLALGDVSESVSVTAAAPVLQSTRGTVSFTVDEKKVVTLPLDGRNFIPLIALSPGVNLPPGSTLPRINGSRPRVSEYIYDGISVLQPEPGQVAYFPIIDAIEEFRVETNSYSAEYGRSNGGVIMV
ncbi:MAG: carboxypeptidase regulatory-like domain-containing protein, partial [Bryobacteraceae bacterium]|nr:carboxypeptidase regulatory-like domain-containing protein [Bryobacteraceae bacterium]